MTPVCVPGQMERREKVKGTDGGRTRQTSVASTEPRDGAPYLQFCLRHGILVLRPVGQAIAAVGQGFLIVCTDGLDDGYRLF